MKRVIEQTADGSATLFVPELNEHYHSVKGARTESQHIFIDMGLNASEVAEPHILEIGFGTGLNALLTLETAESTQRKVHYTGIELYPLSWEMIEPLGYSDNPLFKTLHIIPWEEDTIITPCFTLRKVQADFTTLTTDRSFDIIYFDAFAPEKQPVTRTIRPVTRYNGRERHTYHLLRQRSSTPDASDSRIYCRTSPRPSGRKTGNTKSKKIKAAGGKIY